MACQCVLYEAPVHASGRLRRFSSEEELRAAAPGASGPLGQVCTPDFWRGGEQLSLFAAEGSLPSKNLLEQLPGWPIIRDPVLAHLLLGSAHFVTEKISVHPIRSRTTPPFVHTNLVVIRCSSTEVVIVDPGGNDVAALESALDDVRSTPSKYIFITHRHKDHWDSLEHIAHLFPDAILCGSEACLAKVPSKLTRRALSNRSVSELCGLTVVPTPGHTDGDLSLMDRSSGLICVGDHCVGHGSSLLDAECGNMTSYLDSCKALIELKPTLLIPAHGPLNFETPPKALLEGYIKHRLDREAQIVGCLDQGLTTPEEIVAVVYASTPKNLWGAAMSNIILHLARIQQLRKSNV